MAAPLSAKGAPIKRGPCAQCETMFTALSSMLEAAVSVGVDAAAGLLFEVEASSAALASLRQSDNDLTDPDDLRKASEILCQAMEDDGQRRQLLTSDGTEVDSFFMDLLLRSICSSDVVRTNNSYSFPSASVLLTLDTHTLVCPADAYLGHPGVSQGNRRY